MFTAGGWVRAGSKKKRNVPNGPVKGEHCANNKVLRLFVNLK